MTVMLIRLFFRYMEGACLVIYGILTKEKSFYSLKYDLNL